MVLVHRCSAYPTGVLYDGFTYDGVYVLVGDGVAGEDLPNDHFSETFALTID